MSGRPQLRITISISSTDSNIIGISVLGIGDSNPSCYGKLYEKDPALPVACRAARSLAKISTKPQMSEQARVAQQGFRISQLDTASRSPCTPQGTALQTATNSRFLSAGETSDQAQHSPTGKAGAFRTASATRQTSARSHHLCHAAPEQNVEFGIWVPGLKTVVAAAME